MVSSPSSLPLRGRCRACEAERVACTAPVLVDRLTSSVRADRNFSYAHPRRVTLYEFTERTGDSRLRRHKRALSAEALRACLPFRPLRGHLPLRGSLLGSFPFLNLMTLSPEGKAAGDRYFFKNFSRKKGDFTYFANTTIESFFQSKFFAIFFLTTVQKIKARGTKKCGSIKTERVDVYVRK